MALLTKALSKKPQESVGLLKKASGDFCKTPQESINQLMTTHYPDSKILAENSAVTLPKSERVFFHVSKTKRSHKGAFKESFITEKMVQDAINSFSPHKSPGLDMIKPVCLQQVILNKTALSRITNLFKACIEINYTPKSWRESKVIFIPKPGKDDYSNMRSFRPISLLSFFFKTAEHLVLWHLETTKLKDYPISEYQHGFRKGKSCDTIISCLVDDIESSILRNQYALTVNLDIQNAFDSLSNYSIIKAMKESSLVIS